jgi:hypothetical protein
MKQFATLLAACLFLIAVGCGGGKTDPRSRPDFVDTSDPSNVIKTMKSPPKSKAPGPGGVGPGGLPAPGLPPGK